MRMKYCLLFFLFFSSCGYTTFLGKIKNIYVKPVINSIKIAKEERAYKEYNLYPLFLDKLLTNRLVEEINLRGAYSARVSDAYLLECKIYDFKVEGLRYTENDEVSEQRLKLYVKVKLFSPQSELLKKKTIVGQTTYFLSGPYRISQEDAYRDLVKDTAQRIVEFILSDW